MKKTPIKILSLSLAVLVFVFSAVSASALTTYDDGILSFAETEDDSFVSLFGMAKTATADEVSIVVPDSSVGRYVNSVYQYAFYQNERIRSVDFSQARHLNSINNRAFSMSAISGEVTLPASLTTLGYSAFQECANLTKVSGGSRLKEIPDQCFCDCSGLKTVILPQNLEVIGRLAFADCPTLEYVFIPESVIEINDNAFNGSFNTVIYCYYGTYAHTYAKAKGISYHLLNGVKLGDTDGDGSVSITDVTLIQRYLAELDTLEGIYLHAADANQDGSVDISDATVIQMYLADYELTYPIGEVITQ